MRLLLQLVLAQALAAERVLQAHRRPQDLLRARADLAARCVAM